MQDLAKVGLPAARFWNTPHYAASATDYKAFASMFSARVDRGLDFESILTGQVEGTSPYVGQIFPYVVTDVYGQRVLPENMGNYEPEAFNNHPPRLAPDLVAAAAANLVVRDSYASFFYHPYLGVDALRQIVDGVRGLGYQFVSYDMALQD